MDEEDSRSSLPEDGKQSTAAPAQPVPSSELREDQIQNAVSFLSHPKVRGSPKASKVSFLQQKGLTEAEIDEAFRRVPETPVPALPITTQQPQQPNSTLTTISNHVMPPQEYPQHGSQQLQHPPQEQPVRWSQVAIGAGFAAASVYAVKSLVWPFVSDKYIAWRGTSTSSSISPDTTGMDAADVNAVADAIRGQTAELASSIETLKKLIAGLDTQRAASPEEKITASEIRQNLHTIAASLNEIVASPRISRIPITAVTGGGGPSSLALETELSEIKNLLSEYLKTPRSGDQTPPGELHRTTTPGSYSSPQERPLSEAPSPIQLNRETSQSGNGGSGGTEQAHVLTTATSNPLPDPSTNPTTTATATEGRHPASYMEVLEMLERGETPPGIRDDINDKAPNPEQPPPPARMKPLPKPWEKERNNDISSTPAGGGGDGQSITTATAAGAEEENGDAESVDGTNTGSGGAINLSPVLPDDGLQQRPLSSNTTTEQQAQQQPQQNSNASPFSPSRADFRTTAAAAGNKGATSIFEAATSSQGSPGVIAGRLSPSSDQRGRGGGAGGGRVGVAAPTALFPDTTTANGDGGNVPRPPRLTTTTPLFPDEGGSLGRPTSRGWRPPPIPMPTLTPPGSASPGEGAIAGGSGMGMKNSASGSGSASSLGADFAAA